MPNTSKPSFLRLFMGGFAVGAVALVGFQAAQAEPIGTIPVAYATTR